MGDRMIVLKQPYTSLIMDGTKTLELRCRAVRGEYYLADSTTHTVKGKVTFGESRELSQEEYENTRHQHCVEHPTKRYKKTVGTIITSVQALAEEPSYKGKRGAIGFARFQPAINLCEAGGHQSQCIADKKGNIIGKEEDKAELVVEAQTEGEDMRSVQKDGGVDAL